MKKTLLIYLLILGAVFLYACTPGGSYDPSGTTDAECQQWEEERERLQKQITLLQEQLNNLSELNRQQNTIINNFEDLIERLENELILAELQLDKLLQYIRAINFGLSISMPETISHNTQLNYHFGFERNYRFVFYRISGTMPRMSFLQFVFAEAEANNVNLDNISEEIEQLLDELTNDTFLFEEPNEPTILTLLKYFDVSFEFARQWLFEQYVRAITFSGFDITDEGLEIPNPYILFTFNTERINQFHSVDPAQHAEARQWLIEWLEAGNRPYESYSAFRAANPQ